MRRHVVRLRRCVCVRRARLVHAVHRAAPGFWRNVSDHLVAGRPWVDRAVVIACAAATGLLVVGFTLLAEGASHLFSARRRPGPYAALATLIWTPALTVVILWWTRRFVPGAAGSGIPQVIRALDDDLQPAQRAWLVSVRVSLHKAGLVSAGLLAGLSIGREGPTVQVGAGIMHHARRWLSPRSGLDGHDLMVAGAAMPSPPSRERLRSWSRVSGPRRYDSAQRVWNRSGPASCTLFSTNWRPLSPARRASMAARSKPWPVELAAPARPSNTRIRRVSFIGT